MFDFVAIAVQLGCLWLAVSADSLELLVVAQTGTLTAAGFQIVRNSSFRSSTLRVESLQHSRLAESRHDSAFQQALDDNLDDESARLLIAGAFSIVGFLLMAALLFALTGSLKLAEMQATLRNSYRPDHADMIVGTGSRLGVVSIVILFAATGLQTGLPPFQVTLSNVFERCPARMAGFIAVLQRLHAAVVIWKLGVLTLVGFEPAIQIVSLVSCVASAVIGTAIVCRAESLRGLAGGLWTTNAASIFLALAIGVSSPLRHLGNEKWNMLDGLETAALLLATSSAALLLLMVCERCVAPVQRRVDFQEDLIGLGQQRPGIALSLAASLLTFCAIPPLPGFWSFGFLVATAFVPGLADRALIPNPAVLLTLGLVGCSMLIVAMRAIRLLGLMFLHESLGQQRGSFSGLAPVLPAAIALLLLCAGMFPRALLEHVHQLLK